MVPRGTSSSWGILTSRSGTARKRRVLFGALESIRSCLPHSWASQAASFSLSGLSRILAATSSGGSSRTGAGRAYRSVARREQVKCMARNSQRRDRAASPRAFSMSPFCAQESSLRAYQASRA